MPNLVERPSAEVSALRTAQIFALEKALLSLPEAVRAEEPMVTHHFSDGVYVRAFYMPRGMVLTGQILREDCVTIVKGHVRTVTTVQEEDVVEVYQDFAIFSSPPGMKRAVYALEDTVWMTVHPNPSNERDPEKLWERFVADGYEEN